MSGASTKGGPERLGKYEIRGMLGRGAMGTVYDGWDPVIDRRVAIKTVRLPNVDDEEAQEGLARFKREAQAAGRLTHPNIVGVFDYGETDELAYIVMEFVEGRSLKDVLGGDERMPPATAVSLMLEVLSGLSYSHGRGVVHRDIKPANIMMAGGTQAKIADFGIARIEASSMTQAGTVMGTPAYMSPEQFMGQVVDQRTDIYSCGVMMYQLLTGERPFEGSMTTIMHKVMNTIPPRPSELAVTAPAALDTVVAKAMARRPEDRFATAAEFAQALQSPPALVAPVAARVADPFGDAADDPLLSDETMLTPPPRTTSPPPRPSPAVAVVPAVRERSKAPLFVGGGLALVAVVGIASWLALGGHTPGPAAPATPSLPPIAATLPSPSTPPLVAQTAPSETAPPTTTPTPDTAPNTTPGPVASNDGAPAPPTPPEPPAKHDVVPPTAPPAVTSPPPTAASRPSPQPTTEQAEAPTPPSPPPRQQQAFNQPPPPPVVLSPPVAPPPVVQPTPPPRPAPPSRAAVEAALTRALASSACTLAQGSVGSDGSVTLSGLAGAGPPAETLQQTATAAGATTVTSRIRTFDGPYCPVLDLLRPLTEATGRQTATLTQEPPVGPLGDNQPILVRAAMPAAFGGYLQLAYVQHDSTVAPLVPGPGYPAQTYAAGAVATFGAARGDFEGWRVGPPFGTDMIVAIASTAPLFEHKLPDTQTLGAYLTAVQAAIDTLRRRGGSVAATALLLETRP